MMKKFSKNKKAFSLAEVLVVLAIISATIVNISLLGARAAQAIKKNEVEDQSNGILVQSMEIVKTPAPLLVDNVGVKQSSIPLFFSLEYDEIETQYYLEWQINEEMTYCDQSSPYFVNLGQETEVPKCLQVKVNPRAGESQPYVIDLKLIYEFNNEPRELSLKVYRYGEFIEK